jgi:hypothetical protein
MNKPRTPDIDTRVTDRRYARCLLTGGHHYGDEVISRDFRGTMVELRICRKCSVPESPKNVTAAI